MPRASKPAVGAAPAKQPPQTRAPGPRRPARGLPQGGGLELGDPFATPTPSNALAPKQNRGGRPQNPPPGSTIAIFVASVQAECEKALAQTEELGSSTTSELVFKLAHAVWEVKTSAWAGQDRAHTAAQELAALAPLGDTLSKVFNRLALADVPETPAGGDDRGSRAAAIARLAGVEVGLTLAAVYFDCVAMPGGGVVALDESVGRAAVAFLGRRAAPGFAWAASSASKPAPGGRGGAGVLEGTAVKLAKAIARVLRSAHHALAASRYASLTWAYHLAPAAVACLSSTCDFAHFADLKAAAGDLIVALAGLAEGRLQNAVVEELVRVCAAGGVEQAPRARGRQQEALRALDIRTAALIGAIAAPCLPARLDPRAVEPSLVAEAARRYRLSEDRASAVIAGLLRQTLLEAEAESAPWSRLEAILQELLAAASDEPRLPAAPLLLLCLVRGLAKVAGAPRTAEISWPQREFAVKLLADAAGGLCLHQAQLSSSGAADEDVRRDGFGVEHLRQWVAARHPKLAGAGLAADAPLRLLTAYHAHDAFCAALLPPGAAELNGAPVEAAALPADDSAYSCSFQLCAWIAERAPRPPPAPKRRGQSAQSKEGLAASVTPAAASGEGGSEHKLEALAWLLPEWTSFANAVRRSQQSTQRHDAIAACAAGLHRRLHFGAASGAFAAPAPLLAHARRAALDACLALAAESSLAHVRRQALLGIGAALESEPDLVRSHCVAKALMLRSQDDAAMVRFAVLQVVGRLPCGAAAGDMRRIVLELRSAARSRMSDSSPMVRFAAYRVVCADLPPLELGSASAQPFLAQADDLLRRIAHEAENVRLHVLKALEVRFLRLPICKGVLHPLAVLALAQDKEKSQGVREILRTHGVTHGDEIFLGTMRCLGSDAVASLRQLAERGATGDAAAALGTVAGMAALLEQVSAECPAALHNHIETLLAWIAVGSNASPERSDLARRACRILTNALPSWATEAAEASTRKQVGQRLQESLSSLLEAPDLELVRAAVICFCKVAADRLVDEEEIMAHFVESLAPLKHMVVHGMQLDATAQRRLCRLAWIVATTLEHLDLDVVAARRGGRGALAQEPGGTKGMVDAAAWLLSTVVLKGHSTLLQSLVPCLGFVARRYPSLLHHRGNGGIYDALRSALVRKLRGAGGADCAVVTAALEALAGVLEDYRAEAESVSSGGAPRKGGGSAGGDSDAVEAATCLASLTPEVIELLHNLDAPAMTHQALRTLKAMFTIGVLHVTTALPGLIAACLTADRANASSARRLLFELVENKPDALASRLGAGVRRAAESLAQREGLLFGASFGEPWRFAAVAEAYAEVLSAGAPREKLLDAVFAELASVSSGGGVPEGPRQVLLRVELLIVLLGRLPLRTEGELGRVLRSASDLLILRAMPLLPEAGSCERSPHGLLGVCVVSVLLHQTCELWAKHVDAPRILKAAADGDGGAGDQPLPAGFSRRPAVDAAESLCAISAAAKLEGAASDAALLAVLGKTVHPNSWLLRGQSGADQGRKRRAPAAAAGAAKPARDAAETAGATRRRRGDAPRSAPQQGKGPQREREPPAKRYKAEVSAKCGK